MAHINGIQFNVNVSLSSRAVCVRVLCANKLHILIEYSIVYRTPEFVEFAEMKEFKSTLFKGDKSTASFSTCFRCEYWS